MLDYKQQRKRGNVISRPYFVASRVLLLEKLFTSEKSVSTGKFSFGIYNHPQMESNLVSRMTGKVKSVAKLSRVGNWNRRSRKYSVPQFSEKALNAGKKGGAKGINFLFGFFYFLFKLKTT
jgi:hypothetical protein